MTDASANDPKIADMRIAARELFTSDDAVDRWFETPAIALGSIRPKDLIVTDEGAQKVKELILALTHGHVI